MGSGFSKMKKQARALEQHYEKAREEMKNKEFSGSAGAGLVKIVLTGEKEMKEIRIKPECVDPSDVEGLQDLIRAAYHDAFTQANAEQQGIPDLAGVPKLSF